jgi:mandelate racemase
LDTKLTFKGVNIKAVLAPLPAPLRTGSGILTHAPVLLVDILSKEGVVGLSYLFSPREDLLKCLKEGIDAIAALLIGREMDPAKVSDYLDSEFRLFGGSGILTMARAAIDMAIWDAISKARGIPLYKFLGGSKSTVSIYQSSGLGIGNIITLGGEAQKLIGKEFTAIKLRLGYPRIEDDLKAIKIVREAIGNEIALMVDYNQCLSSGEALRRCRFLDQFDLTWIEEPIHAEDLEGYASLRQELITPLQIGENLFSPTEFNRSILMKCSQYLMPDVAKVGGVSNWLTVADLCQRNSIPLSSHLYPEFSLHLLLSTKKLHYLEYVNWLNAIIEDPIRIEDGVCIPSNLPGIGMAWTLKLVEKYKI